MQVVSLKQITPEMLNERLGFCNPCCIQRRHVVVIDWPKSKCCRHRWLARRCHQATCPASIASRGFVSVGQQLASAGKYHCRLQTQTSLACLQP